MERLGGQSRRASGEQVVSEIIERIAEIEGSDPLDLTPPLAESIDPDALEKLVGSADETVEIKFAYYGYTVTVYGNGDFCLVPLSDESNDYRYC